MNKKKHMVISGINLFEGGPLRVYYDCLDAIVEKEYYKGYDIDLLVHRRSLFEKYETFFNIIEFPKSRRNFMYRLFYEYIGFYFFSLKRKVDTWFSLHDITPNVKASKKYVYCHNPLIFHPDLKKITKTNYKRYIYAKLYKMLYRCNIKKNSYVIVQQEWMREEFRSIFNIENIIVAKPIIKAFFIDNKTSLNAEYTFLYPAFPREFKNFEVICEASRIIQDKSDIKYKVLLTIDGTENTYSNEVVEKYNNDKNICFIGVQNFNEMISCYEKTNCLIFPSKLETWGLPISEFASTGRDMLLADLPYAHEAVGDYEKVSFFCVNDSKMLSNLMLDAMTSSLKYDGNVYENVAFPFFNSWEELLSFIVDGDNEN